MNILVTGGCKNGKSLYAQRLARDLAKEHGGRLYYFATMIPKGVEDEERVEKHLQERAGWGFETVEVKRGFFAQAKLLNLSKKDAVLFDSLTAALENVIFKCDYSIDEEAIEYLEKDLAELANLGTNIVFVSDNIYCDGVIYDDSTERYRKALANIDKLIARLSDKVVEISFGNEIVFK